jgi:magnesium transporter
MITILKYTKKNGVHKIPFEEFKSWNTGNENELVWIDLWNEKKDVCLKILKDIFNFHPLSIEDSLKYLNTNKFHYPKIDEFGDNLFIVFNEMGLSQKEKKQTIISLSIFLGFNFIITIHCEKDSNSLERFMNIPSSEIFSRGSDYLLHLILDEIVDKYYPLLDKIENDYEKVESLVFEKDPDNKTLKRILDLKKKLIFLRRISSYQKDILFRLTRGDYKFVNLDESVYYRNVYDHLMSITDTADNYRDLITGLLDSYLSIVNNKMNEIIKLLTIFAVILLPLTLFTGIYGMNFDYMPLLHNEHGFFISFGIMAVIVVVMLLWFRKKKWI